MDLDGLRTFMQQMDSLMNLGRGEQCFLESVITPGKARLPRKLKKATKKVYEANALILDGYYAASAICVF